MSTKLVKRLEQKEFLFVFDSEGTLRLPAAGPSEEQSCEQRYNSDTDHAKEIREILIAELREFGC
tara:strand:- start:10709 stop:10903 length:195 start_codon:yes stop_codon:yes gene_type:complete